jgi:hypothetical protein
MDVGGWQKVTDNLRPATTSSDAAVQRRPLLARVYRIQGLRFAVAVAGIAEV